MRTEVEAKFLAGSADPLDDLAEREILGSARLGTARTVDEVDRYLDTDDGRLATAGWACRLRSREGRTRISLKGPPAGTTDGTTDGWHHRRPEEEGPATGEVDPGSWPVSPARELLASLAAGRTLAEFLRLDQRRTERAVEVGSERIATLTLDRVRMVSGSASLGELFVVELELDPTASGAERELGALAGAIEAIPGLAADPRTKLEHALERRSALP